MAKVSTQILIDNYVAWFKKKITFTELEQADEIVTPYVNHLNDRIRIYVEWLDDFTIQLSDDGLTYSELELMGLNLSTDARQRIISEVLDNFQIAQTDNGELYVVVNDISEFAQKKHNLIQAILQLYDLVYTDRPNVVGLLKDYMLDFFYNNDFGGNIGAQFKGESGILHRIDYSLGATKGRPNTFFKFLTKPSFQNVTEQKYIYDDLKKEPSLNSHGLKIVIVSDAEEIGEKAQKAIKNSKIDLVHAEDHDRLLEYKGIAS